MQQYTRWLLLIHQEPSWVYLKKKIPTNLATLSTKDHSLQLIQFLVIYAEPQGQLYFQKKLIILILQIASGSDDLSVIIWDWEKEKNLLAFNTGHKANVFQVRRLSTMFIIIFRKKFLDGYFFYTDFISLFYTALFLYSTFPYFIPSSEFETMLQQVFRWFSASHNNSENEIRQLSQNQSVKKRSSHTKIQHAFIWYSCFETRQGRKM